MNLSHVVQRMSYTHRRSACLSFFRYCALKQSMFILTTNNIFALVPDELLKVVRVNAKQTDTRRYTCKMHRLECSACGECKDSVWVRNWQRWDMRLTKLRHMSHQAEKCETPVWPSWKGDRDTGNMVIKDIIIILKLANQFGWLACTQFQQKNFTVMLQTPRATLLTRRLATVSWSHSFDLCVKHVTL